MIYLFPESQSAIVVLTNTNALGDATDWIAQASAQTVFDDPVQHDWVAISKRTRDLTHNKYNSMKTELENHRPSYIQSPRLDGYPGVYYDATGLFFIRIARRPDIGYELALSFQGRNDQCYDLRFYHDDIFEWLLSRDETAKRGRYHMFDLRYFILVFVRGGDGGVVALNWHHDANLTGA